MLALGRSSPLGLVATLALHGFALVDQDYLFPYVRELDPWHRWPLSTLNYLVLWAAGLGLIVGTRRWWRPGTRLAWSTPIVMAAVYAVVYLPTAVECRFGLPLFTLLAPAAAVALLTVGGWARERDWRRLLGAGASAVLTVGACAWLSIWMQAQAPNLVFARELLALPPIHRPIGSLEAAPPERWVVDRRQTYLVRLTNESEQPWFATPPVQVVVHVMFVGPGGSDTVDSRVEARLPIPRKMMPGETLEMELTVSAPRKEGVYRLRHQLELDVERGQTGSPPHETTVTVNERR
jgi:hypothetical protein